MSTTPAPDSLTPEDAPDSLTPEDVVAELREVLAAGRGNNTMARRLAGGSLTVLYEFPEPYTMVVTRDERRIDAGAVPYEQADVVIRAAPATLHRLTSGELGGREAIVGGLLDIRKAPALNKLLLMRALFNVHKKSKARAAS
jgi:putative sterol carrier protein